jgi:hypothetical protein
MARQVKPSKPTVPAPVRTFAIVITFNDIGRVKNLETQLRVDVDRAAP